MNLWNLWWFRHALVDLGQSPFHCQLLFYPYGVDLRFHTLAPLHGLFAMLPLGLLSLAAVQNLLLLFDFTAAGTCTYALGRRLGLNRGGALLAGAIFAFSPAIFAHLYVGHFELIATYWLPAAGLLFLRIIEAPAPKLRDGLALGLLIAVSAYSCQYYCLYSVELLAVIGLLRWRRVVRPGALRTLGLAAVVGIAGISPVLSPFWASQGVDTHATHQFFSDYAGDLASALMPSFTHPVWGARLRPAIEHLLPERLGLPQETTIYLGWLVLALALAGTFRRANPEPSIQRDGAERSTSRVFTGNTQNGYSAENPFRLLWAIFGVFFVLALGSELRVWGVDTGIPMPARVLEELPFFRQARAPGRHIILAMLPLALLAGIGWSQLRSRGLAWFAILGIAAEFIAVPVPLYSTRVSEVYSRLSAEHRPFAVLELPFGIRDGQSLAGRPDSSQLLAQTIHGHPIVSGMVSRLPLSTWNEILAAPVIGTLLHPTGATREAVQRDLAEGADYFRRWRINAIIVHQSERGSPQEAYLERVLPAESREEFANRDLLLWLNHQSP